MSDDKPVTVSLQPDLLRVLRIKAEETDRSVSDLINEAVRAVLAEGAEDLAAFEDRAREPVVEFESIVQDLKGRGVI